MKKLVLLAVCCVFALGSFAQEEETQKKEVLLMDYFTYSSGIGSSYVKMLRDAILGGIQETGRLTVVDVDAEPTLRVEETRRQDEKAMSDATARTEAMKSLGAKYAVTGHITDMSGKRMVSDDGSVFYDGQITFNLKVLNIADGSVKVTKAFTYSGLNAKTGSSPEQAVLNTTDYVKMSMQKFINENFKLESVIVAIETTGKKGAETVYVNCGTALGIQKGQLFDVFVEKDVAGKKIRQNVGQLKAQEVQGDDMTLCKVAKGGEAIKAANDEQRPLIVVSGKKAFNFMDAAKDVVK